VNIGLKLDTILGFLSDVCVYLIGDISVVVAVVAVAVAAATPHIIGAL
jgi:hypothetical protein